MAQLIWGSPAALPRGDDVQHAAYDGSHRLARPAQNIFLHATRYRMGEDVARETILITTLASLPVALLVAVVLG